METIGPDNPFWREFEELGYVGPDGKRRVETTALMDLVRKYPEDVAAAAQTFAEFGAEDPGLAQRARALAGAYEAAFGDDSLMLHVDAVLERIGAGGTRLLFETPQETHEASGWVIDVSQEMLDNRDTFPLVELFSHSRIGSADPDPGEQMRAMRGRCRLTFPVPAGDPREVFEVPAVRDYVAELNRQMPYLPFFLNPDPREGMLYMWLACLAPPEALSGGVLALHYDAVIAEVTHTTHSVRLLAQLLGDDGDRVITEMLSALPAEYIDVVLALEGSLDNDGG